MQIGQVDIADIEIDMTSRDDIPSILLGLQYIYTTEPLRKAVFKILEDVIPTQKKDNMGESIAVDANKGRPGMDQWCILVLGTLRLGLNADYDRIQELANQHRSLRAMLGHGLFTTDKDYRLQTLKDNLQLFTPEIMERINVEVVRAGHLLLDVDIHSLIRGRCDSFVLKTDVHFPTDINLLYDAIRVLIRECCINGTKTMHYLNGVSTDTICIDSKPFIGKFKNYVTQRPKMKIRNKRKQNRSEKLISSILTWHKPISIELLRVQSY
jgi:hypothetical protein